MRRVEEKKHPDHVSAARVKHTNEVELLPAAQGQSKSTETE